MSVSAYTYLILGVRCGKSDFFKPTGTRLECRNGHKPPYIPAKFCPTCGNPFEEHEVLKATKAFREYAKANDATPEELWEEIEEDSYYMDDFHEVGDLLLFGDKLSDFSDYDDHGYRELPVSNDDTELELLRRRVEAIGLDSKEIKLWHILTFG